MRVAVVDIGSNSVRLLAAEVEGEAVEPLARESNVTRLGEGVERCGGLSPGATRRTAGVISRYVEQAHALGVERLTAIATSAVRDSANGAAFLEDLEDRFGLEARLLDGEAEARLSFAGAVAGRRGDDGDPALVIDIGGGSTELIVGEAGEIRFHDSLRLGVVRHGERHITTDPPEQAEIEALAADASGEVRASLAKITVPEPRVAIAVAGTPTSLAAIDLGLAEYDPARVHGHKLPQARIEQALDDLAALPEDERRLVTGLQPDRAPTIVPGIAILLEVMAAFGVDEIEVSEHDILWGAVIAAAGGDRDRAL